jgi:hypothetical protein
VSSDGGALLLRQTDLRINLLGRLAGCFSDGRSPWLVTHHGLPVKPVEHQIEWGAFGGGPVIKNRLFLFSSYDKYFYHSTPNPTQYTVPSVLARTGDFTEYSAYPIYDPSTTAACTAANAGVKCRNQAVRRKNRTAEETLRITRRKRQETRMGEETRMGPSLLLKVMFSKVAVVRQHVIPTGKLYSL